MKDEFKILLLDKANRYALVLSVTCILLELIFFTIKVWSLPPVLPLFYNRPWGTPQLGTPLQLFLLLVLNIAIVVINLTFSLKLYKQIILLSRVLLWISVLISLLTATTTIRIIFLIS